MHSDYTRRERNSRLPAGAEIPCVAGADGAFCHEVVQHGKEALDEQIVLATCRDVADCVAEVGKELRQLGIDVHVDLSFMPPRREDTTRIILHPRRAPPRLV